MHRTLPTTNTFITTVEKTRDKIKMPSCNARNLRHKVNAPRCLVTVENNYSAEVTETFDI